MNFCWQCDGDDINLAYADNHYQWWECIICHKMRSIRVQEPRGSRWVNGLVESLVECSGEIGC